MRASRSVRRVFGDVVALVALGAAMGGGQARAQSTGMLDSVLDADPANAKVAIDGLLGIDEYGPGNVNKFVGAGGGFGGTLGAGAIYMKQDIEFLYIGVKLGAALNDDVCLWLDTRAGGFTDAEMDDGGDGGRRISTNLTRDSDDLFDAAFRPDFTVVVGSFGIVVFELTAGTPITFLQYEGVFLGTDPALVREIAIPKASIAMGTTLKFLAGYFSESNFTSDEAIPPQSFTGLGNPGFGGPGVIVDWTRWNEFGPGVHPGSRWKIHQLEPGASVGEIRAQAREYYEPDATLPLFASFRRWELTWVPRANQVEREAQQFDYSLISWAQLLNCPPPFCPGPSNPKSNWRPLGPFSRPLEPTSGSTANGVGIIASMWVDPSDSAHILLGAELGGLWETIDGGVTWRSLTDQLYLPNLGCRDICVDPFNTQKIYICAGFGDFGLGVIKTTDGGATWSCTALQYTASLPVVINRVVHHPSLPNTLYALVGNKIYRTTDGGATWPMWLDPALTCFPTGGVGVLGGMEKDPGANNIWYVHAYANPGFGIPARMFSITDNGTSWVCSEITPKTSSSSYYATGGFLPAVAPSQPGRISAYFLVGTSAIPQMATTTNGGLTWSVTGSSYMSIAGARIGGLVISPTNPLVMYLGGVVMYRSVDGGQTFQQVSVNSPFLHPQYVHDDVRVQIFRSGTPGSGTNQDVLYIGSDGGPYATGNGGANWIDISGQGLNITKFYGLGASTDRSVDVGGCQDLSTMQYDYYTQLWWNPYRTGDGYETVVKPSNSLIVHTDAFGGWLPTLYTSTDGADTLVYQGGPACSTSGPCTGSACQAWWNRPLQWDNTGKLYVGNHDLWVSANDGVTWTQISDFTTSHNVPCGLRIKTIAVPASDPTRIYVGFEGPTWGGGSLRRAFRTSDSGATWIDIGEDPSTFMHLFGINWANLTHIEVDPDNKDRVWACFGDYWPSNRVWYSANGGDTWTNVSAGLTDAPLHDIVYRRCTNQLYAAADNGVYYWDSTLAQWVCWKDNLPSAVVWDLEIHEESGTIVAATHGRGLWEADMVPASKSCGCVGAPTGMTLWLPLDEGTGSIGNNALPGNDATHHAGPAVVAGKVGAARLYDANIGQWSDVPSYPEIKVSVGDFSVEGWIKRAGTNPLDGLRVIMDKRAYFGSTSIGYHVWLIDGELGLQMADGLASFWTNYYSGAIVPLDGQWHQFAVTVDRDVATGIKFYIDGVQVGVQHNPLLRPGSLSNNAKLAVGAWTGGAGGYFHGAIDELEVFTRALSAADVANLYNAQNTGKCRWQCQLPALSVFCPGDTVITVNATICNAGISTKTFTVWFQGLGGGDGCDVPGPVNYVPFGQFNVTVAGGACQNVPVQIGLPTNPFGAKACYIMFVKDPVSGQIRSCRGTLQLPGQVLCGGFDNPTTIVAMFNPTELAVHVTSVAPETIFGPYQIEVIDHDGLPAGEAVRLNGLPPGEVVIGKMSIAGGTTVVLDPVTVEFVGGTAHGTYSLVLSADADGDGVLETIGASALQLEQGTICPSFSDDFESSSVGEACADGSWEAWQHGVDVCGQVTEERAFSGARSLKIVGTPGGSTGLGDDTVLEFEGATSGAWTFRCMTYVPTDAAGDAYVLLLNTYDDDSVPPPPPQAEWYSSQIRFITATNRVRADIGVGETALVRGQWAELRIEIDLDKDVSNYFYNGVHFVVDRPWTAGVAPGFPGLPQIAAIDLYAGEPGTGGTTGVFFDDVALLPGCESDPGHSCLADWDYNGVVNSTDVGEFINDWFEDQAFGTTVTDFNHDGLSNSTDVGEFINSWFEETALGCG